MFTIDHINELRAELAGCFFSREERRALEAELAALLAERDALGKAEAGVEAYRAVEAKAPAPS